MKKRILCQSRVDFIFYFDEVPISVYGQTERKYFQHFTTES